MRSRVHAACRFSKGWELWLQIHESLHTSTTVRLPFAVPGAAPAALHSPFAVHQCDAVVLSCGDFSGEKVD